MTGNRFRFGVQHYPASSREEWRDKARRAEELGYDTFLMPDHIGQGGLAYAPALIAAADVTSTIRIGTLVLGNDFRHPALVASEAATLDLLSGGRFELGIGAGWDRSDYDVSGMPFDQPRIRLDRLEESISIIKQLLTGEPVTFHGQHYTIQQLENAPRLDQRRRPPLLMGGGGPRMLTLAAREADILNIMPPGVGSETGPDLSDSAMVRAIDGIQDAAAGRLNQLELGTLLQRLIVTNDARSAAAELGNQWGMDVDDVLETPWALIGSVEAIVATLCDRRDRFGLSYWTVFDRYMEEFAPVVAALSGK